LKSLLPNCSSTFLILYSFSSMVLIFSIVIIRRRNFWGFCIKASPLQKVSLQS
jgi:hypothetical protein